MTISSKLGRCRLSPWGMSIGLHGATTEVTILLPDGAITLGGRGCGEPGTHRRPPSEGGRVRALRIIQFCLGGRSGDWGLEKPGDAQGEGTRRCSLKMIPATG